MTMLALITVALCALYLNIRIGFVYNERQRMLDIVFSQPNWKRWLDVYRQSPGFDYMMIHFWVYPIHKMWSKELLALQLK